jgi:hypothetical protein
MYRTVRWIRSKTENKWTVRVPGYWRVDLSFTCYPAIFGGLFNKNAKLVVRKRTPGKTIANEVIMVRHFKSAIMIKQVIDSLLILSKILFEDPDKAEKWVLQMLNDYDNFNVRDKSELVSFNPNSYTYSI